VVVPVRLLPRFDNLMLGWAPPNRGRVLPAALYDDVIQTRNGQVQATVLVDGTVAGLWEAATRRRVLTVTLRPLARWPAAVRRAALAVAEQGARFRAGDGDVAVQA
jgi:hypothetical protein